MSETPGASGDAPDAYEDENAVLCPACDSTNTVQFAARGLQYQCQDCNNEFNPSSDSMDADLR